MATQRIDWRFVVLQVSDPHFGGSFYHGWEGATGPVRADAWRFTPRLKSTLPHDPQACFALDDAAADLWWALRRDHPSAKRIVLCSGDLTAAGDDAEMVNALTFLHGALRTHWTRDVGLRGGKLDATLAIPGNHDHNLGSKRLRHLVRSGPARGLHEAYLGGAWWHQAFPDPSAGLQLQLMGVDSNAGAVTQLGARGYLEATHLERLGAKIADADRDADGGRLLPVRVLAIHHSLQAPLSACLAPESLDRLRVFCTDHSIHYLLTGHEHTPWHGVGFDDPSTGAPLTYELRCGTTLQGAPRNCLPVACGRTFLVHRLGRVASGDALWRTDLYQQVPVGWSPGVQGAPPASASAVGPFRKVTSAPPRPLTWPRLWRHSSHRPPAA